jgi:hypothetical protein
MAFTQWFGLLLLLVIGGMAWVFLRPGKAAKKDKPGSKNK